VRRTGSDFASPQKFDLLGLDHSFFCNVARDQATGIMISAREPVRLIRRKCRASRAYRDVLRALVASFPAAGAAVMVRSQKRGAGFSRP